MVQIKRLPAATLAVAATLLCNIASAQFSSPARFDFNGNDDIAVASAVNVYGDVAVVGRVYNGSYWELECVCYGPTGGTPLWTFNYGTGYDGFGTAISADQAGNFYCSGVQNDSSGYGHFMVVKLRGTDGTTVWPNSGSYGSGSSAYEFDTGVLRLTDSSNDGVVATTGQIVCSLAVENVDSGGGQPTFAIAGPSEPNTSFEAVHYRAVEFEDDGSGGVQMRSGWPIDDVYSSGLFVVPDSNVAYGVAIDSSDDSLYLVGANYVAPPTDTQFMTVVKYDSTGTQTWIKNYSDGLPVAGGRAIALNEAGDVYATGYVSDGNGHDQYETFKIPSGSTDGSLSWHDEYDHGSGTSSIPNAISLSAEVEAGPVLATYVYVTGQSQTSGLDHTLDIASLRIDDSGSTVWSDRRTSFASHDDIGYSLFAAGRGNIYVGGTFWDSSGPGVQNYYLLAMDKSQTARYSPVTYNNGGEDECYSVVMGGAGLPFYTGRSHSGNGFDFLTNSHVGETVYSFTPSSWTVPVTPSSGGTSSYLSADDGLYFVEPYEVISSLSISGYATFSTTVSTTTPSELSISIDSHVDTNHIWQQVKVWDYLTSSWVTVSDRPASNGTDDKTIIALKDDPARYISSGVVLIQVWHYGGNGYTESGDGGYNAYFDQVRCDVIGT